MKSKGPIIISSMNQKGGVGKTTSVINIASEVADSAEIRKEKKRVLIIDVDPQANASSVLLGKEAEDFDADELILDQLLFHSGVLRSKKPGKKISDLIVPTYKDNLDVIPSGLVLEDANIYLSSARHKETALKLLISENSELLSQYMYIFIDCPPSMGILTQNAMVASNYVLIPVASLSLSVKGLRSLLKTIKELRSVYSLEITVLGIILTFFDKRKNMAEAVFENLKKHFPNYFWDDCLIKEATDIDKAMAMGQSIGDFKPNSQSAKAFMKIANRLISRTTK